MLIDEILSKHDIRKPAALQRMSEDDKRNTLIVELNKLTGTKIPELQKLNNTALCEMMPIGIKQAHQLPFSDAVKEIKKMNKETRYRFLLTAMQEKNAEVIKRIIKADREILHYAVYKGNIDALSMLLTHGANPDSADSDEATALHVAATHAQINCAKLLLAWGANINAQSTLGNTALHCAVHFKHEETIAFLIEYGISTSLQRFGVSGTDTYTAAEYAKAVHPNMTLHKHIAERKARRNRPELKRKALLQEGVIFEIRNSSVPALPYAVLSGITAVSYEQKSTIWKHIQNTWLPVYTAAPVVEQERLLQTLQQTMSTLASQHVAVSPLQLDMGIIHDLATTTLQSHITPIVEKYAAQAATLNSVLKAGGTLNAEIQQLHISLQHAKDHPEELSTHVRTVSHTLTQIQLLNPEANAVVQLSANLFDRIVDITKTEGDAQTAVALAAVGQGFELVGAVATLLGKPGLGADITKVGQSAVSIVSNAAAIMPVAAAFGPVGLVAGGAIVLFSVFGSKRGPSAEQQAITQLGSQLQHIAEHLDKKLDVIAQGLQETNKQMHEQFNQVNKTLEIMHQQTHQRFDIVEKMLGKTYQEIIRGFANLSTLQVNNQADLAALTKKVDDILIRTIRVHEAVINAAKTQYMQPLHNTLHLVSNLSQITERSPRQAYADRHTLTLVLWATGNSSAGMCGSKAPAVLHGFPEASLLDAGALSEAVKTAGIDATLNHLARYAQHHAKVTLTSTTLANPFVWDVTARAYANLFLLNADIIARPPACNTDNLQQVIQTGEEIKAFIDNLRTSKTLFQYLLNKYNDAIHALVTQSPELVEGVQKAEKSPSTVFNKLLQDLAAHFDVLVIFCRLAFPDAYEKNANLRGGLDQILWQAPKCKQLMFAPTCHDSKIQMITMMGESAGSAVENFKAILLDEVERATRKTISLSIDSALEQLTVLNTLNISAFVAHDTSATATPATEPSRAASAAAAPAPAPTVSAPAWLSSPTTGRRSPSIATDAPAENTVATLSR